MEDLEDTGWTISKTGQGYQNWSVSRQRVKDSSDVNWCGRRPWSPTIRTGRTKASKAFYLRGG